MKANLDRRFSSTATGDLRVMTYNMLAQNLIRRDMFPCGGKNLRWTERFPALRGELIFYRPDLLFLQEVDADRLKFWQEVLDELDMDFEFSKFPGRSHGCLIAFNKIKFERDEHHGVEILHHDEAGSHKHINTGNIAMIVCLRFRTNNMMFKAVTTHLYWHPNADYERLRQVLNLLECVGDDPTIIGADFNSTPDSPAYQFLFTGFISREMKTQLRDSARCEQFGPLDGPLEKQQPSLLGDVDAAMRAIEQRADLLASDWRNDRNCFPFGSKFISCYHSAWGSEPRFTNWTENFRATIDYIFTTSEFQIESVLGPLPTDGMPRGLPSTGYPSDHIPLAAVLAIKKTLL